MKNAITFECRKGDVPLQILLEPQPLLFNVLPGNEIAFVGESDTDSVEWAMRFYQADNFIHLFPECPFDITIYENGELLTDWWKYM